MPSMSSDLKIIFANTCSQIGAKSKNCKVANAVECGASVKENPFSHGGNFSCTLLPQKLRANEHSARELLFSPSPPFKATAAPEHSLKIWWTLYKEESKAHFEWSCPLHKRTCSSFNPSQRLLQPIQDLFKK